MYVKGNGLIKKNIGSIFLIQLGDIGDVVLSLPCVRALRECFPEAHLAVGVREKARDLMEHCSWSQDVISVCKKKRSLFDELSYQKSFFSKVRGGRFDLAIDLRTGTRGALLAFLSGAGQRIGIYADDGKVWRNRLFSHLIAPEIIYGKHVSEYYLSILTSYGIEATSEIPEYQVPTEKKNEATVFFREEAIPPGAPVVAVHPFSLWKYKEWGDDKYVRLINWLSSELDVTVIIIGSGAERKRADRITERCLKNTFNVAGKTSLSTLAAILKACGLFIGGDSVGVHLAAAVGTPTASIFGPTSSVDWAPKGPQHLVIKKDYSCVPCRNKGCEGSEKSRCLEDLDFEEVRERLSESVKTSLT